LTRYKVTYIHHVEVTYEAEVEADSEVEAYEKAKAGDVIKVEETSYQGVEFSKEFVDKVD